MNVKYNEKPVYTGSIPRFGETFMVPGGDAVYMRIRPYNGMDIHHKSHSIMAVSMSSGCICWMQVNTRDRFGFRILDPDRVHNGQVEFVRRRKK